MMDEPWMIYLEELQERGEDIPLQEFNRETDMREAARETRQAVTDRFHNQLDMDEETAVDLTKGFGRVVREWVEEGAMDWDDLADRLEVFQHEWDPDPGLSRV